MYFPIECHGRSSLCTVVRQVTKVSTLSNCWLFYFAEMISVWLNCSWVWSSCRVFSVDHSSIKTKQTPKHLKVCNLSCCHSFSVSLYFFYICQSWNLHGTRSCSQAYSVRNPAGESELVAFCPQEGVRTGFSSIFNLLDVSLA